MNWIQVVIMWCGIAAILPPAVHRLTGHHGYLYFWEYVLVVMLITAGLIFTVGVVMQQRRVRR